ncbi:MAG: Na+/H+ antiporter NhaC family protein, partial [Lachnospiraceae bacterium]|nr:Na+/H+ antiporter NhaC family protein [Lachnospiraceae bacterium]
TGADCKHIRHVETQLPYATLVAIVCAIGYLIAGYMNTPYVALIVETVILVGAVFILSKKKNRDSVGA